MAYPRTWFIWNLRKWTQNMKRCCRQLNLENWETNLLIHLTSVTLVLLGKWKSILWRGARKTFQRFLICPKQGAKRARLNTFHSVFSSNSSMCSGWKTFKISKTKSTGIAQIFMFIQHKCRGAPFSAGPTSRSMLVFHTAGPEAQVCYHLQLPPPCISAKDLHYCRLLIQGLWRTATILCTSPYVPEGMVHIPQVQNLEVFPC